MTKESYASVIGDIWFYTAISILLIKFIKTKSCADFSGKMQILYTMVMTTRTLNLMFSSPQVSIYYVLKTFILNIVQFIILYLIYVKYHKTYEAKYDKFWIESIIMMAVGVSLLENRDNSSPGDVIEAFSGYVEALVILPQIYFTYRSEKSHKIISSYILFLTLYNLFYIFHWVGLFQKIGDWSPYTAYPTIVCFVIGISYFLISMVLMKESAPEIFPQKSNMQKISHQQSLLEFPFLKRSMPSNISIYTVSLNGSSANSSINGSVKSLNIEGRY